MIKVNLLPVSVISKRYRRDFIAFVGICAAAAVVISLFLYFSLNGTISPLTRRLDELTFEVRKHQAVVREIDLIETDNTRLERYRRSFRDVLVRQYFWPELLYAMYEALPENVWLEEIESNEKDAFVAIKGTSLSTTVGIADFIQRVEDTGFFASVQFTLITQKEMFGKKVMAFELRCFLASDAVGDTS